MTMSYRNGNIVIKSLMISLVISGLSGCSYLGTVVSQADYSVKQLVSPEQHIYKHMLSRETFFVFGRIKAPQTTINKPLAVVAISDAFQNSEVVDVNHLARPDSYYGMNLPAGEYRLLVVSDRDGDGFYDQTEIVGGHSLSVSAESVSDKVLGGFDIDLATLLNAKGDRFRVKVRDTAGARDSLFFPNGTLRSLDDPIFAPDMATLGLYKPAAFLEAAPMMFYALEEDVGYKVPVIFVHGIDGSARDFEHIVARLDRTRYKPWFFYYPSGTDLNQLAAMFYKLFLSGTVIPLSEMPVVIVAHSMGGLVVREALNLQKGGNDESHAERLITIASPMGGHPGARSATLAPVVIPSWRDINPDSKFISQLHRKALPAGIEYHLMYTRGKDRISGLGADSDGVVPLSSQLDPAAQAEAIELHGFNDSHTGVLGNKEAIDEILRIVDEVHAPFPDSFMHELMKGGYRVKLGPHYTPMEAHFIHNLGFFMEAMASGKLVPFHPSQEHFVKAVRGDLPPEGPVETAWIKFRAEYPDRLEFENKLDSERSTPP